ncbi:MAG: hypothetical protein ABIV39_05265 [Verrucomicrobiota bacterium]
MRTKTLLLTAVLSVAAAASSMADVFSVNVVGYVNTVLRPGFNMIANPLRGTNNGINTLIPTPGVGSLLYKLGASGSFDQIAENFGPGNWDVNLTLAPGEGAFIQVPALTTNTFVGEVIQGTTTNNIPAGFSIRSSIVPQSAGLTGVGGLEFPAVTGDIVFLFNAATQAYSIHEYFGPNWDVLPVPAVGQSFWVQKAAPASWVRTFNVN